MDTAIVHQYLLVLVRRVLVMNCGGVVVVDVVVVVVVVVFVDMPSTKHEG